MKALRQSIYHFSFSYFKKFAFIPLMIAERTDAGLCNDGFVSEADDETAGINQMIILEDAYTDLLLHNFLKVLVG